MIAAFFAPLFADAGDIAQVVIFLVVAAIYGINHIIKAVREMQKTLQKPPARPVEQGEVKQRLERELDDFMRRARGESAPAQPPPPPQQKKRRRNQGEQKKQQAAESKERDDKDDLRRRKRLEPRLEQHIDTSRFEQRARHLTNIDHEADDIQQHVHQVFDHKLGALGSDTRDSREADAAAALVNAGIEHSTANRVAMNLADPESLRDAIVMQEILNRPTHRW